MKEHTYKLIKNGITYYMTQEEYEHADEWIAAIEQEVAESTKRMEAKKAELYSKWRTGK